MSEFDHYLQRIILEAAEESRAEGRTTIEAQHLLLAIARDGSPVLSAINLDYPKIRAALAQEFTKSLAAAGVRIEGGLPPARPAEKKNPDLGATARQALDRGFAAAPRKRDCRPAHVLLGIVTAPVGTVPRALDLAGVDRAALTESVRREIADAR